MVERERLQRVQPGRSRPFLADSMALCERGEGCGGCPVAGAVHGTKEIVGEVEGGQKELRGKAGERRFDGDDLVVGEREHTEVGHARERGRKREPRMGPKLGALAHSAVGELELQRQSHCAQIDDQLGQDGVQQQHWMRKVTMNSFTKNVL